MPLWVTTHCAKNMNHQGREGTRRKANPQRVLDYAEMFRNSSIWGWRNGAS